MHLKLRRYRPAIAMIELIFAIMIMGIVMMSVPQLLTTMNTSGYVAIQQEGINEAATQANIMLGYEWDENNTVDGHGTILNTNGVAELNGIPATPPKRRAGTPALSRRLFISYDGKEFNATAIGLNTGETIATVDDIDDFNGTSTNLALDGAATTKDYIEKATVVLSRAVAYISDAETGAGNYANGGGGTLSFQPNFASVANTTNIKSVTVTLTSTSAETELNTKQISFYAFSCNIGSYELEEK